MKEPFRDVLMLAVLQREGDYRHSIYPDEIHNKYSREDLMISSGERTKYLHH